LRRGIRCTRSRDAGLQCQHDPDDVYRPPETWARRAYHNLIYFHEVDKGGHFAAWEQPQLFSAELRAAFSALR
jgi:pimeloyl-ACP methyl ester carboxylesterase